MLQTELNPCLERAKIKNIIVASWSWNLIFMKIDNNFLSETKNNKPLQKPSRVSLQCWTLLTDSWKHMHQKARYMVNSMAIERTQEYKNTRITREGVLFVL